MPDDPYIEAPDVLDDHERNGLICFLSGARQCGADCMAYTTQSAESNVLNEQQKHCIALVSLERLGRHSGLVVKTWRDIWADIQRMTQTMPKGG
jgi:hypothetical protein